MWGLIYAVGLFIMIIDELCFVYIISLFLFAIDDIFMIYQNGRKKIFIFNDLRLKSLIYKGSLQKVIEFSNQTIFLLALHLLVYINENRNKNHFMPPTQNPNPKFLSLLLTIVILLPLCYSLCLTQQTNFSVNYIMNGDFQTPYLGPNRWRFTTDQLDGWSSTKIEQGTGSIYNTAWGPNTQVIEMDTNGNQMYNQTLILPESKFLFRVSYAARNNRPLNSSGLRIWWNEQVIFDLPESLDRAIHTQTFILQAKQGTNKLTLEGAGIPDGGGMTCDNVIFNKIENFHREEVNGQCLCSRGFFDDMVNWNCQPCILMDPECQVCDYNPINITTNGTINSSNSSQSYQFTCSLCNDGFFSLGGSCTPCSYFHTGCSNCSQDGLDCYSCDQPNNYFMYSSNRTINQSILTNFTNITDPTNTTLISQQCMLCNLTECLNCSSLYTCSQCNTSNNNFLNYTNLLCEPCTLVGCSVCTNLAQCQICDFNASYYFANSTDQICTYCDNSIGMFLNASTLMCQPCTLVACVTCLSFYECERCSLEYYLSNSTCLPCTLTGCLQCLDSDTCVLCDQSKQYFLSLTGQCQPCLSCSCRAGGRLPSPAIPPLNYSQSECQQIHGIEQLSRAISIISYIILFFALISVKIVGLELFGVLQLAYFNLADNQFVNLYLSPLLEWKYLNGYNIGSAQTIIVPPNVIAIGYCASFLSNINIMFLVLVVEFLVSLILIGISIKVPVLKKVGKFMFQQVFLTLFLFNSFNIAFSAGLHFKYANPENTQYFALSTAGACVGILFYLIILIVLQTAKKKQFGEFKQKFKKDFVNQLYISISVIYRMALGLYMAIGNQQIFSSLLILSISLAYIMYNIINLPFSDFYQNYRSNLCHITQLLILFVTNYYRSMKANEPLIHKARIHTPAKIQLSMLVICVLVSTVCLAYEIYLLVRDKIGKYKGNQVVGISQSRHNFEVTQITLDQ